MESVSQLIHCARLDRASAETDSREKPAVQVVGDILDNSAQLVSAAMSSPEAELEVREKTVGFGEFFQFLKNDYLSDFAEKGDLLGDNSSKDMVTSSFRSANNRRKFPRSREVVTFIMALKTL